MKRLFFIFLLILIFLYNSGNFIVHTVTLVSPPNNSYTNLNNNSLAFIYNHSGSLSGIVNCTLYLDGQAVNYQTNVSANTNITTYSNQSWSEGTHYWYVNCTNGTSQESSLDIGHNFTFIADFSPPNITNVRNATPMATTTWILWNLTNYTWNNRIKYSTNQDLSNSSWSSWQNNTQNPRIKLWNLEPNTTYYYQVYSYNPDNSSIYSNSSIYNFTTPNCTTYEFVNVTDTSQTGIDHPIQEAIDMICESGGIVELATGNYTNVNSTIKIKDRQNITIRGTGETREETEILYDGYYPTFPIFQIEGINCTNITMENIYIHSTATGFISSSVGTAIKILHAKNITLSNFRVERLAAGVKTGTDCGWGTCPQEKFPSYITVEDCLISNCRSGINFWRTLNSVVRRCEVGPVQSWMGIDLNIYCKDNLIEDSIFHGAANSGIKIYSGNQNTIVRNNICYGNNNHGIWVFTGGYNTTIINNTLRDNNWDGIGIQGKVWSPDEIYILNNKIYNNGRYGVGITLYSDYIEESSYYVNIKSNTIFSNSQDGIRLDLPYYIVDTENNIITNNGGYGIHRANMTNTTLNSTYNNLWNNTLGPYNNTNCTTCIEQDPLFADPANGDFHLKSQAGRWNGTNWVKDNATSPCIDAGDPNDNCQNELYPHGQRINLGAYGNTEEASKSPYHKIYLGKQVTIYPDLTRSYLLPPKTYYGNLTLDENFSALPSTEPITIQINKFNTSLPQGEILVNFTANTTNGNNAIFTICSLTPSTNYIIKKNNTYFTTKQANSTGCLTFNNSQWSEVTFTIEEAKPDDEPCSYDWECSSGNCLFGLCKPSNWECYDDSHCSGYCGSDHRCYSYGGGAYIIPANETNQTKISCGNGICEENETWENCPEDCITPPEPSSVSTNIIEIEINKGENKTISLQLNNNLGINQTAYLSSSGNITSLIIFNETTILIPPASSKKVEIRIVTNNTTKVGTYKGEILVKIGNVTHRVQMSLTITPEKKPLLKANIEVLTKELLSNGTLKYKVEIYNLGTEKEVDLILYYQIRNLEKIVLAEKNETLSLKNSIIFERTWELARLNLGPGEYYLSLETRYDNTKTISQDRFKIIFSWWYSNMDAILILVVTTVVTLVSIFIATRIYKRRMLRKLRYLTPVDYKSLPSEGLEIGKIPLTRKNAYLNKDDLMTHVIIAGATGSGKTVSAMVIAEEILKQKLPVIVFDPTGQWTGFVKPCRDSKMLSKYKNFNLKEEDVRSFPGMIYEVKDPNQKIDLKKYLNPGEITIFALDKLTPGEYDLAVQNIIDTIFEQDWEESGELRVMIIFDEIHRLLKRYGGRGGYISLEKAAREFRKWGLGIIMISQILSDFKEALKGNVLTEIQMNTKALRDIDRARQKYGEEYAQRITREEVGVGMIQNPKYNRGKPYWIAFRPLLHSPHKIPEEELELYEKYAEELERIEEKIKEKREVGEDTFDLEIELKLAKNKLKGGKFRMAEIYITSLKNRLEIIS